MRVVALGHGAILGSQRALANGDAVIGGCLGFGADDDGVVHRGARLGVGFGAGTHDDRVQAPAHRLLANGHAASAVGVAPVAEHRGVLGAGADIVANRHAIVRTSVYAGRMANRQGRGTTGNGRRTNGHGVIGGGAVIPSVGVDGGVGAEILHAAFGNGLVELLDIDRIGTDYALRHGHRAVRVVDHGVAREDADCTAGHGVDCFGHRCVLVEVPIQILQFNDIATKAAIRLQGHIAANQVRHGLLRALQLAHVDCVIALRAVGYVGDAALESLTGVRVAHGDRTARHGFAGQVAGAGQVGFPRGRIAAQRNVAALRFRVGTQCNAVGSGNGILAERHRLAARSRGSAAKGYRVGTSFGRVTNGNGLCPASCTIIRVDANGNVVVARETAASLDAKRDVAVADHTLTCPVTNRGALVALHVLAGGSTDGDVIGTIAPRDAVGADPGAGTQGNAVAGAHIGARAGGNRIAGSCIGLANGDASVAGGLGIGSQRSRVAGAGVGVGANGRAARAKVSGDLRPRAQRGGVFDVFRIDIGAITQGHRAVTGSLAVAADRDGAITIGHGTAFGASRGTLSKCDRAFGGCRGGCAVAGGEAADPGGHRVRANGDGLQALGLGVRFVRVGVEVLHAAAIFVQVLLQRPDLAAGDRIGAGFGNHTIGQVGDRAAAGINTASGDARPTTDDKTIVVDGRVARGHAVDVQCRVESNADGSIVIAAGLGHGDIGVAGEGHNAIRADVGSVGAIRDIPARAGGRPDGFDVGPIGRNVSCVSRDGSGVLIRDEPGSVSGALRRGRRIADQVELAEVDRMVTDGAVGNVGDYLVAGINARNGDARAIGDAQAVRPQGGCTHRDAAGIDHGFAHSEAAAFTQIQILCLRERR